MPLSTTATVGSTETRNTHVSAVTVLDRVDNQYLGSAKALKKGAEQLIDMIFASKQQIQILRNTSQLAIDAHKAAAKSLELPKSFKGVPSVPRDEEGGEDVSKNQLLAENGLQVLIDKITSAELSTAKCFEKLANPKKILATDIIGLNTKQEEIKTTLLDNKRLGKAHHRTEQTLTSKAEEVNDFISLLRKACTNHGTVIHPLWDPYVLHARTEYKMKDFLQTEFEYEKYCLRELLSIAEMDEKVFTSLRGLSVEMEKVMTPLRNECVKVLEPVERLERIDPLTDWNGFVETFGGRFVPENMEPVGQEYPGDEEYKKFQIIVQSDLEIYHKPSRQASTADDTPDAKVNNFLNAMKRAKEIMTPAEHGYGVRGVWYVSVCGNLIEFDHKECKASSIFQLQKCRLGILAPDEMERYGYFVMEGIRQYEPSDKKSKWMKKVYKFRNKWEKAKEMHKALAKFCKSDQIGNGGQMREVGTTAEDAVDQTPGATEDTVDTMAGSTLVDTEGSAS